jgi:class 3 adenylate cyclase/tetratricopeptide (TPR) repeat protein
VLLTWLALAPENVVQTVEGTAVFVDLSGFTRLSERLARTGKEGAEHLTDSINACFSTLLADAYAGGGSLLKFGGDALWLWFWGDEHPTRACASAAAMRSTLRRVGRISTGGGKVVLRMSIGVHSGHFHMFLVGESHREHIIAGPATTRVVEMEAAASAGQILLSPETASMLPERALGAKAGPGVLLARPPSARLFAPEEELHVPDDDAILGCLSTEVRAHVLAAPASPEHRTAVTAFVQFGGLDDLIETRGATAAARAVDALVKATQEGADLFQVCFLGSDVGTDGWKLLLTARAPRAVGDDEERMLLTLRHILEQSRELPVRIGVNRGRVFAFEIGPPYRRTYAVMGDTTNLAARLMAKAPWGSLYATEGVLVRSQSNFETSPLVPFMVKGKSKPIEAWEVGPLARPTASHAGNRNPLVGRDEEYAILSKALVEAKRGKGALIEIIGETGTGKSRLLAEARELAGGVHFAHTICENYRRTVPYVVWRDVLRQLLGLHWDDPDDVVTAAVLAQVETSEPGLRPWLPLLAIVFDVSVPMTQEVGELAADYREAKLHEVVLKFLRPWLETRTLVQIEHAHSMDKASAALLTTLARHIESSGWVITVTRREVEVGFVGRSEWSTQLVLGPLSADAMHELAESAPEANVVPPHVLELAVERASGSPEFLLDLLAAAARGSGELPDSIDSAATARIDELDPRDRVLVRRASVLGLCFHRRLLPYVLESDLPEPDEPTWKRISSVFADDGDGYIRFKRPALREVAYEGLPFRLRRKLHGTVGQALEPDLGRDADADPAVLSVHFSLAGDHPRAWRYARLGAERAAARFAHGDAAQLYRRAIDAGRHDGVSTTDLADAWESLGRALQRTGELAAAAQAVTVARGLMPEDPLVQGRLLYRHMLIAQHAARLTTAVRWANRALRTLDGLEQREAVVWRARTLARLAFYRVRQGRLLEAERLCHEAIAAAKSVSELEALAYAYYILDFALDEGGRAEEAIYSALALEIYDRLGDLEQKGSVLNNLGCFAMDRWNWTDALPLLRESAECSERAGVHTQVAAAEINIATILFDRGVYAEASRHVNRALRLWTSTGDLSGTAYATVMLGRLAIREGRDLDGFALLHEGTVALRTLGEQGYAELAESWLAEAEALAGDARRALAIADTLTSLSERPPLLLQRVRVIALARLGRENAGEELAMSLEVARERGALHDLAAGLDLAEVLTWPNAERARERDEICERLGIERLPTLPAALLAVPETAASPAG